MSLVRRSSSRVATLRIVDDVGNVRLDATGLAHDHSQKDQHRRHQRGDLGAAPAAPQGRFDRVLKREGENRGLSFCAEFRNTRMQRAVSDITSAVPRQLRANPIRVGARRGSCGPHYPKSGHHLAAPGRSLLTSSGDIDKIRPGVSLTCSGRQPCVECRDGRRAPVGFCQPPARRVHSKERMMIFRWSKWILRIVETAAAVLTIVAYLVPIVV